MSLKSQAHPAPNQIPSVRFAMDPLCAPVEQIVSEHTGQPWRVKSARDMTEFACHPSAILSDGSYSVFVKFSQAANGLEQIDPGFCERRDLWRVWGYLAAVTVEGPSHLGKLTQAVRKYI